MNASHPSIRSRAPALAAALLTTVAGGFASGADPAAVADRETAVFLVAPDLPTLDRNFDESAFGALLENEELRKSIFPETGDADAGGAAGLFGEEAKEQWERYGHFFDGGLAVAITLPEIDWESADWEDFEGRDHFAIIAGFSGSEEDLAGFLEPWSDERPGNLLPGQEGHGFDEEFMGHNLRIEEVTSEDGGLVRRNGWALVNGTAVLAQPVEYLRDAVARIADPSEGGSLAGVDRFLDVRGRAGESDLLLFVNLGLLAEFGRGPFEKGMASAMAEPGANPLDISPEGVFEALGLDALRTFHLSATFGADRSVVEGGLFYREKKGLLHLLAHGDGPIPLSSLAPGNPLSTSVGRARWADAWLGVKEMLAEISPGLPMMIDMTRNNLLQSTGVDFERSLIGGLGEELVAYTASRDAAAPGGDGPPEVDSVVAFELSDPAGFVLALEGIKGMFGADAFFDKKDFEGAAIHTSKTPMPGDPQAFFSYAIAGDLFLIGTGKDGLLEGAVARWKEGGSGFWNRPEVRDLLAELPDGAVGASYADLGSMIGEMVAALALLREVRSEGSAAEADAYPGSGEDLFPHFVFSGQFLEENGFFFESLILPKERLAP
ncbi:MAG: hypothetical protein ACLFSZ_05800 [Puniceicoccaceae bacterium]